MRLAEKHIERTIRDFLELDGWTVRKMEQNFSERKRKIVGEKGMPDLQAIRYSRRSLLAPVNVRVACEVLWVETKALDGELDEDQRKWHERERARGAQTVILGVDCAASIESWIEWYRAGRLNRRIAA